MDVGQSTVALPLSRRTVLGAAVAAGAAATVPFAFRSSSYVPQPYAFDISDGIDLIIGAGERFAIEVRRGTTVLERHDDVTEASVTELESEHFRAYRIEAPTPLTAERAVAP